MKFMPHRNVYHVVHSDDRWVAKLEGSPTHSAEDATRDTVVLKAADYVRRFGSGRVVVHAENGQIETVHSFDELPTAPSGWIETVLSHPVYLAVGVVGLVALGVGLARRS
ncbi:MAG: hypothetical protein Rubg2KO_06540 [Rubricoccaceae bacterium]